MEKVLNKIENLSVDIVSNLFFASIVVIIGFRLSSWILKIIQKSKGFRKIEKSVQTFIISFLNILLKSIVLITVLSILGVPMTSIIAVLGSIALALGLALQGGLSNIAGSLMILIFKPFKVGDYIETDTLGGYVSSISLFHTTLITLNNKKIIMPNGDLSNKRIINYSSLKEIKCGLEVSVSYNSDIDKVKKVLEEVIINNKYTLKDKPIDIYMIEHSDNALKFEIRSWSKSDDYFLYRYSLLEEIKKAFDKNKIVIPFPQMDIHLNK